MKTWISVLLLAVFMVNLVGCSNMTPPREGSSRAYIGMFSGAIAGGLVGSNFGENRGGRVGVIAFSALVGGVFWRRPWHVIRCHSVSKRPGPGEWLHTAPAER